ncbi:MAG TPA: glycosyltransferase family 4 protein [Steroidobacteraceae bacterium]|nr:glycosyltransferase family 4 protein [Steroidobacteraceae bacterium]
MSMAASAPNPPAVRHAAEAERAQICLMTGGQDPHYAYGLATALVAGGARLDVIGSNEVDLPEFHHTPGLRFLNLRGDQSGRGSAPAKIARLLLFYIRLLGYSVRSRAGVVHILWNNRFEHFDRTLLLAWYRLLGKKIAFTAHNVNVRRRDGGDSWLNRLTLRIQYRLVHCIFVHTERMKAELMTDFGVPARRICVIPYGINNAVPETAVTLAEARAKLDLPAAERVLLCFGAIAPYKGFDLLLESLRLLHARGIHPRVVIAGKPKGGCDAYLAEIQNVARTLPANSVRFDIGFVPDDRAEMYFKAADALLLPYRNIFQSGVLFLGFGYGLPAIATDVGDFREDVVDGETGFLAPRATPEDFADAIEKFLASPLGANVGAHRAGIRERVRARHAWDTVARITAGAYRDTCGAKLTISSST